MFCCRSWEPGCVIWSCSGCSFSKLVDSGVAVVVGWFSGVQNLGLEGGVLIHSGVFFLAGLLGISKFKILGFGWRSLSQWS